MGVYDGAEVCELIGIFLLNLLGRQYVTKNIGLHRDYGFSIIKNCSDPQMEKIKKQLQKVCKNNGLDVFIECSMKIVNYLHVTFNTNDGTYRPYQKHNIIDNIIQYVHVESNHPPNIINQIPNAIEKRLSQLSSNEDILNESASFYEDRLYQSGYQPKLNYNLVNTKTHNKRNHKRNIIWFKPPFSKNVSLRIGKYFLNLLDKHFQKNHRFHKMFNRNSVTVSYDYTKNMKTIINNHNVNIMGKKPSINTSTCNC